MRLLALLCLSFLILGCVTAWENADYEIFDLVSDIEESEGKGTTFYSWLGVPPSASTSEIGRAYRRKSLEMHPDKNPTVKNIQKRFARLGVVAQILRNQQSRERYDFFFKNGVPKWRGTGYYYARYRPGLGSVLIFLIFLTSGLQYLVQRMNHSRDVTRVGTVIAAARSAAWGPKLTPLSGSRKVKVNMGGSGYVNGDGEFVGSKALDMVVDGDAVFLVEPNGSLIPLDDSAATPASISSTWFISLVVHLVSRLRATSATEKQVTVATESDISDSDSPPQSSLDDSGSGSKVRGGQTANRVGGRRRKTAKRT